MRINSQVSLMNTQRNNSMTSLLQASTMQKLSSGNRINSAKDDAAGMAIAAKMASELGGINQASRNTMDGISMIQTAEGATNEVSSILNRMSELATQSANGIYGAEERSMMNNEFNQLKQEINDIASRTSFNNMNLLDGSLSASGSQRTAQTEGISVSTSQSASRTVATQQASVSAGGVASNTVSFNGSLKVGDVLQMSGKRFELVVPGASPTIDGASPVAVAEAATNQDFASAMRDALQAEFGDTFQFEAQGGQLTATQLEAGVGDVSMSFQAAANTTTNVQFDVSRLQSGDQISLTSMDAYGNESTQTYTHSAGNSMTDIAQALGGTARGNSLSFENQQVSVEFDPVQQSGSGIAIQSGTGQGEQSTFDIGSLSTAALGLDDLDISTQDGASQSLSAIRNAQSTVSDQRSTLGAMQNRFESKVSNLAQSLINQTEARSRINDTDMAMEMMRLTQQNIMSRAQTAVMAQGNANAGNVLSLLR